MTLRTDLSTQRGQELFWARVIKTESCWVWKGNTFTQSGYGRFKASGRDTCAHIFAWEMSYGPVPSGLELDHTCHNADPACVGGSICLHRRCVRPDHLEAVTHRTNELRGKTVVAANAEKKECEHGHPLSGRNLLVRKNGSRRCQACERARQQHARKTPAYRERHAIYERERRARRKGAAA